eukprot:TRINITY_DN30729_c0_g1_i8.p2 TRINITY_DN30729_c0_g1~~TRINITY_DN30729_c0_g1_i8.p2  ORF type:complete len:139 (-),score=25.58 TRINITY_DN30729_c0_g1_i8:48-464(-)
MSDPELEAIRQKRMKELMAQQGGENRMQNMGPEAQLKKEEAARAAEEQRMAQLAQVMKPEAKERLSRIGLVKPDKARRIEDMIINMAKAGRLADKISEQQLIQMLEQVNEKTESSMKVTIQRRRQLDSEYDYNIIYMI